MEMEEEEEEVGGLGEVRCNQRGARRRKDSQPQGNKCDAENGSKARQVRYLPKEGSERGARLRIASGDGSTTTTAAPSPNWPAEIPRSCLGGSADSVRRCVVLTTVGSPWEGRCPCLVHADCIRIAGLI